MDLKTVLGKTQKGLDEISTRADKLPQQKRNVLIIVDGRFSVGDLLARFPNLPDLPQTLRSLFDAGYIAIRGESGAARPAAPARPTPAATTSPSSAVAGTAAGSTAPAGTNYAVQARDAAEFRQAVRELSRSLYDTIGPAADNVTGKLEQATDREAFLRALQSCLRVIEISAGKKKASAFEQRAAAIVERFLNG